VLSSCENHLHVMHGIHTALDVILEYAPGLKRQNLASHPSLPVSSAFLDFLYIFYFCPMSLSVAMLHTRGFPLF
jgi:hypothetical protein